ncbi:acyl-CoA thioesterase II [Mesorhizobium sp. M1A.F.Ca.ET.072.01.1.1]|uniref:acyl-CoA thioesterase n=1 Tax=Mesorhizobium sp. M1A.F.Ca.ET.072.01.1.1 TaxID=2496753 RepID=UPI000FD26DAD|nr:acyl-CoA thioesterase II [Mesorhizobium sp. M1A.F.Ca.ET.072.01.1.1]RUW51109.1 acyl-CoA thioesterase II [Mesorhizobium sp. M1A.F.Ca.ET.072.01.1.1]TIV03092.1 MAG: acyl-CoA thioesterase II [Mesorhizobium sp.]
MSVKPVDIVEILSLEMVEANIFVGTSPKGSWQPIFGGQLIGQSMAAACRTVEGRLPHSLHAYFVRPGNAEIPFVYKVDTVRDGQHYSIRHVTATQAQRTIFSMDISFHTGDAGYFDHQHPMPDVLPPEKLTTEELSKEPLFAEVPERFRRWYEPDLPIVLPERVAEMRPLEISRFAGHKIEDGRIHFWMKPATNLPDNAALHICALAFACDWSLLDAVLARYGLTLFDGRTESVSLDHAMWFHRPFRSDEWLLYAQDSPSAQGSRGMTRGLIYRRDGTLVASVAQEGLLRMPC